MAEGVGAGSYALGVVGLLVAVASLAWGGWSLRRALLPSWSGCRARVVEVVIALSLGLGVAQLAGAVGALRPLVVGGTEMAAGLIAGVAGGWWRIRRSAPSGGARLARHRGARTRAELTLGGVAVLVPAVQWISHAAYTAGRGMTHPDTFWYHMPFATRFVQTEGFPRLDALGYEAARWFPFNAQLVHSLAILAFDRDWLSSFINLGWALLAAAAAWTIGARRGAGVLCLAGAAVVLGLPAMAATQPGQASTDIATAALLLTALALLLESDLDPAPLAVAGLATGLALSTKVTIAVPVAILVALTAGLCLLRRRPWSTAAWLAGTVLTGSFWFLRNWVLTGNPLPWFDIPLGALTLERVVAADEGTSLLSAGAFDGATWDQIYRPGLHQALGPAWPVVLGLFVVSVLACLWRRRRGEERIIGLVALAGAVGYLATPLTSGLSFVFNLRYLTPVLLIALVALPTTLPRSRTSRLIQLLVSVALVVANATAPHLERTPAWPSETFWAVGAVLAIVAMALALHQADLARRLPFRATAGGAGAGAAVVLAVGGWLLVQHADEHRYLDAGIPPTDAIPAHFRAVTDSRVVLYGSVETYALFGLDLSNDVRLGSPPSLADEATSPCRRWRSHLGGRWVYVVVSPFGVVPPRPPPVEAFAGDPAAELVVHDGAHRVYRLSGPLDPDGCPDP